MDDATRQSEQESRARILDSFGGDIITRHLGTPLSLRHQPVGPARILQFASERFEMMDGLRERWATTDQPSSFNPLVWRWKAWRRQFGREQAAAGENVDTEPQRESAASENEPNPVPAADSDEAALSRPPADARQTTELPMERPGNASLSHPVGRPGQKPAIDEPAAATAAVDRPDATSPTSAPHKRLVPPHATPPTPAMRKPLVPPQVRAGRPRGNAGPDNPDTLAVRANEPAEDAVISNPTAIRGSDAPVMESSKPPAAAIHRKGKALVARQSPTAERVSPVRSKPEAGSTHRTQPDGPAEPPAVAAEVPRTSEEPAAITFVHSVSRDPASSSARMPEARNANEEYRIQRVPRAEFQPPSFRKRQDTDSTLIEPRIPTVEVPPVSPRETRRLAEDPTSPPSVVDSTDRQQEFPGRRPAIRHALPVRTSDPHRTTSHEPELTAARAIHGSRADAVTPPAREILPIVHPVQRRRQAAVPEPGIFPQRRVPPEASRSVAMTHVQSSSAPWTDPPAILRAEAGDAGSTAAKGAAAGSSGAAAGPDIDEIVEKAIEKLGRLLELEGERRGVSPWH